MLKAERYREWWSAVRAASGAPWWAIAWGMIRALASGRVPTRVWRRRIQTCGKCPIYRPASRTCGPRSGHLVGVVGDVGCGCYVPFMARTKAPYKGVGGAGCWGRASLGIGWGSLPAAAEPTKAVVEPAMQIDDSPAGRRRRR